MTPPLLHSTRRRSRSSPAASLAHLQCMLLSSSVMSATARVATAVKAVNNPRIPPVPIARLFPSLWNIAAPYRPIECTVTANIVDTGSAAEGSQSHSQCAQGQVFNCSDSLRNPPSYEYMKDQLGAATGQINLMRITSERILSKCRALEEENVHLRRENQQLVECNERLKDSLTKREEESDEQLSLICQLQAELDRVRSLNGAGISGLVGVRGIVFSSRYDWNASGVHDIAPRESGDFIYAGKDQVLSGAHPLPLWHPHNTVTRPLVSPFLPSPQRVHPYFTEPLPELPHFNTSRPTVYTVGTMKERIIAPVYNLQNDVVHTRELDPFIFGFYPETEEMAKNLNYWLVRCQNFSSMWDYEQREIWRRAKKNWPNTGMGMPRVSDRKNHMFHWGAQTKPTKPWNMLMPTMDVKTWSKSNRMLVTLKMLQGKLQIVERLTLQEPTQEAYLELCRTMGWDVRHTGGGVLFMDGGSRLTPSSEYDRSFFFGSFFNGRNKLVRPTLLCDEQYDFNRTASKQRTKGPKGPKNPIPINRFNAYDALTHHILVITEGALMQLEDEMFAHKLMILPPHIRAQLPERGYLESEVLGDVPPVLQTIQMETAARTEEVESAMYEPYYDNPYQPWKDEKEASYAVDAVEGTVQRFVKSKKTSWSMLT